ncbi:MAG: hypothetical protein KKH68_11430, partial [Proteobacteria bacterium]|nr:hypothetical protein [Pseudomonadota bacterium]
MYNHFVKKRIKQTLILIGMFWGLIFSLLTAGTFYLNTEHARHVVQQRINQAIPGSILLGKIKVSLLKGSFDFINVSLKSPSGNDLAGCDRLFLRFSWLSLFSGKLLIAESILKRPWTRLQIDHEGKIDLVEAILKPELSKASPDKTIPIKKKIGIPFNIVFESFKVDGGAVDCEVTAQNLKVTLQDIFLIADANLFEKSGSLALQIARTTLVSPEFETRIDPFDLKATLKAGRIDPVTCRMGTQGLNLNVTGTINDVFKQPLLDLALDFDMALPEACKVFKLKPVFSGFMAGHMTARGMPNNPDIELNLDYKGGIVGDTRIDRMDASLHLHDRRLTVEQVTVKVASGSLNLNGDIDLKNAFAHGLSASQKNFEAIPFDLVLKQNGIRLEAGGRYDLGSDKIFATLKLDAPELSQGLSLFGINNARGKLAVKTEIAGKLRRPAFSFLLNGTRLGVEDITIGNVTVKADLNPSGILKITELYLENQGAVLRGAGTVQIFADAATDKPRLPVSFSAAFFGFEPQDFLNSDLASGTLDGKLQIHGSLDALEAMLSVQGKQLAIKKVRLGDLAADFRLAGKSIYFDRFRLHNRNSTFSVSGSAQLFEPQSYNRLKAPLFQADVTADTIFLEDFVDNLKGKLSLAARLQGELTRPQGHVQIKGEQLDLAVQKLEHFSLSAVLDGEKANIDALQIDLAPGESVTGSGWISRQKSFELNLISRGLALRHIDKIRQ